MAHKAFKPSLHKIILYAKETFTTKLSITILCLAAWPVITGRVIVPFIETASPENPIKGELVLYRQSLERFILKRHHRTRYLQNFHYQQEHTMYITLRNSKSNYDNIIMQG